ncbi:MAG: hypothetical protein RR396_05755 [Clostridiales bacterium]
MNYHQKGRPEILGLLSLIKNGNFFVWQAMIIKLHSWAFLGKNIYVFCSIVVCISGNGVIE